MTGTGFKDHFSGVASDYASYRPNEAPGLFEWVASLPERRDIVWDCGTGSGQAAIGLADYFARVIATDASPQQLAHVTPHSRVEYRVAAAERSGLADASVDLVTAAQAFHWFDFDGFFAEARRVVAPGGAVVVWTYNLARVTPEIDRILDHLSKEVVGAYWPPERRWVDEEYQTIPFPFPEVETPQLAYVADWDLERLLSYIRTWSAWQRYLKATGEDPIDQVRDNFAAAWGEPAATRRLRWPVFLRASRRLYSSST
ncbi:MAG TPA: class I SAM-dependent methyltransferase [Thermoanaerobaculia bacterium]|nr:class I SAM-dependent methyltransferase [Thermoanaerobaculia bacterium]